MSVFVTMVALVNPKGVRELVCVQHTLLTQHVPRQMKLVYIEEFLEVK